MKERVEEFVADWRRVGVRLVVFIDGTVEESKFPCWLARRHDDAKSVVRLNTARQRPRLPTAHVTTSFSASRLRVRARPRPRLGCAATA